MDNVEIATGDKLSSVQEEGKNNNLYGYHFNMYLRLNVAQYPDNSSEARLNRTLELINENGLDSKQDIITILGDTENEEYPIYRDSQPPDDCSTLATALFDYNNMKFNVYEKCNPKTCEPSFIIDIVDHSKNDNTPSKPKYPITDPNNLGNWVPYPDLTDEFDGSSLNLSKWYNHNPNWMGMYSLSHQFLLKPFLSLSNHSNF